MAPDQYTKDTILKDLRIARDRAAQAVTDVEDGDRVDATDSINVAASALQDALLRLTASLAADPLKKQGGWS